MCAHTHRRSSSAASSVATESRCARSDSGVSAQSGAWWAKRSWLMTGPLPEYAVHVALARPDGGESVRGQALVVVTRNFSGQSSTADAATGQPSPGDLLLWEDCRASASVVAWSRPGFRRWTS